MSRNIVILYGSQTGTGKTINIKLISVFEKTFFLQHKISVKVSGENQRSTILKVV